MELSDTGLNLGCLYIVVCFSEITGENVEGALSHNLVGCS